MAELPSTARVVIIGGGVVGVSALYHLAKMGWADCVLLEKNELTAGSTWHAAGNVPTFSGSFAIMNMQRYSTELYRGLAEEVDHPMNYHVSGSIRLAHSKERLQEFKRAADMGRQQGMNLEILAPDELPARYPFIETHDLVGALYDEYDGDIDPAQLTQALAKGARDLGAKIVRFTPATGVERDGDEWIVKTEKGDIRCEFVVNAAGYYAADVAEWFRPYGGRQLPMVVMSHQYLISETVPEVEAWSKEHGRKLPLLRDVDSSYYLRQEIMGFNLGPYERGCRAHWHTPGDPMPEDFSFQLYPDDLDRIEWYIEDAMARVPLLGTAGISRVINGPIPYAPDGYPLLGPMPGVPNAFEACVFTFGIAQGGGAGKVLAEWITEGATEWDMWAVDPRRFTGYADTDYAIKKGMEVYGHEYAMHFPWHRWPAAPDKRLSPLHDRLKGLGAQFEAYNGWERATWFANDGDDTSEESTQTWARTGPWSPRVQAECEAVRDNAGVLDLTGFSRFELSGDGAADWLRTQIAGALPKVGRVTLGYFPDHRGRLVTEMSLMRHEDDRFTLLTAAAAQWHDFEWLMRTKPDSLSLTDRSAEIGTVLITGPKARDILADLTDGDLTLPWLSLQHTSVCGTDAMLARVSFAGELGWEVHTAHANLPAIYEAVLAAGATPFGMWALDCLRIEKGYRAWKQDLSSDYTLLQSGLERFVKLSKDDDFPGKDALTAEAESGPSKIAVTLTVDTDDTDAPYMAPLWSGDELVGEVTSSAWGFRVGASISLAMVRPDLAAAGTEMSVDIFGTRCRATVQADRSLWDPNNERLRA